MVADFFTKPLQGELFKKFRALILNLENGSSQESTIDPERTTGVCCETSPSSPSTATSVVGVTAVGRIGDNDTGKGSKMEKRAVAH